MQGKGLTAPALPAFPGRELIDQARGRTVPVVKTVHPCRVLSFLKAVSAVMDDLGMDDKIIENLNLIKIWQHVLKGSFPRG